LPGEEGVTVVLSDSTYPDSGIPIEHVLDRNGYIWRVVRDGGMATRAWDVGIISIGISALEREAGPLIYLEHWIANLADRMDEIAEHFTKE
jgi:hypothetical protein